MILTSTVIISHKEFNEITTPKNNVILVGQNNNNKIDMKEDDNLDNKLFGYNNYPEEFENVFKYQLYNQSNSSGNIEFEDDMFNKRANENNVLINDFNSPNEFVIDDFDFSDLDKNKNINL